MLNLQVFHDLGIEEALRIIEMTRLNIINVEKPSNSSHAIRDWKVILEAFQGDLRIGNIFGISAHSPGVEVRFENFGTQEILTVGDIESMLVVESSLVKGHGVPCESAVI